MQTIIKGKGLVKSSKNSTTVIKKSNPVNNKDEIKNRKYSNEKFKTQVINQIYSKIFFSIRNNLDSTSNISIDNGKIKNNSNYTNYINPNKINIKKKIIRNQNNKSINQKSNIPLPLKKTSKKKLRRKKKLYINSYTQNDITKNYLKNTNNTTEVNISLNNENNIIEEKNDKIKKEKNSNYSKSNDNLILINVSSIINNSSNNSNINNYRKLSNNNILNKKNENQNIINTNNKMVNIIEGNLNFNKKNSNKNNENKSTYNNNKNEINSIKKDNYKENNNNKKIESKNNKIIVPKKSQNNIFYNLKEKKEKDNYYFLIVSDNQINTMKNKVETNIRNNTKNIEINNNKTYYLEKIPKYLDNIGLSPVPNIMVDSTLKLNDVNTYKNLLCNISDETIFCDEKENIDNNKINNNEQSISERKNNKYKNIIINQNILNKVKEKDKNKTIHKYNKIKNNKNTFLKFNEEQKPYTQNYDINSNIISTKLNKEVKDKSLYTKKIKKAKNNNIKDTNTNLQKNNCIIKNSNSNVTILDKKTDNEHKYSETSKNIINNIKKLSDSKNLKKLYSNKETKKEKNTKNKDKEIKQNTVIANSKKKKSMNSLNLNETKNDLNKNFFEKFKKNSLSSVSDEDDKTDKEEKEINSPHINKLVTFFNDAKKTLKKPNKFYNSKNANTFIEVISPNKSLNQNYNYNKIEEDELSNRTIKVPIFEDVNLINNLREQDMSNSNNFAKNHKINLYNIINYSKKKKKNPLLYFLDIKSIMILSSINRQFYINLRIIFYINVYNNIFSNRNNFVDKIKLSMVKYASNELKSNKANLKEKYESYSGKKSIYDDLIIKDINRTFPYEPNFKSSAKFSKLYNLLTRYSNYNQKIGYAQGLNFIFAKGMEYFEKEEEVFLFIDGIINLFKIENFMGENNSNLALHIKKYSNIISKYIPELIKYLEKKLLTHDFFSTGWILTLFSNSMNSKNLLIIWSFMIVFGWKFFYCLVIQILLFYKNDIYKTSENNLSKKMKKLLKEERFNKDIKKIISDSLYFMSQNIVL